MRRGRGHLGEVDLGSPDVGLTLKDTRALSNAWNGCSSMATGPLAHSTDPEVTLRATLKCYKMVGGCPGNEERLCKEMSPLRSVMHSQLLEILHWGSDLP